MAQGELSSSEALGAVRRRPVPRAGRRAGAIAAALVAVISACSPRPDEAARPASPVLHVPSTAPPLAAFTGDPFFDPGDAAPGRPGEIIRVRPTEVDLAGVQAWHVLHWSRTASDAPVAVSASILVPVDGRTGARPVFAYTHSTTGMGDQCALTSGVIPTQEVTLLPRLLGLGMAVVVPDYQGLGTPGDHAYAVGQASGRNVLDAIRAASQLGGSGVTAASPSVVWGHSQGGAAAGFAAELQPTYAPEVALVGAIAGAPGADLTQLPSRMAGSPPDLRGFIPMVIAGLRTAYPELAADDGQLSATSRQVLTDVSSMCLNEILAAYSSADFASMFQGFPLTSPRWQAAMAANRLGDRSTKVPILLYAGSEDPLSPATLNAELMERYCARGVTADNKVYEGRGHMDALEDAFGDIVKFTRARLQGDPAPNDCG